MKFDLSAPCFRLTLAIAMICLASRVSAETTPESLKAIESQVKAVVQQALPCTVALTSEGTGAAGSGVVVSKEGLILTAGHVTRATGDDILVFFPDGKMVRAKSLGANYRRDSGMAKIVDEGEYPYVELGKSASLEQDQWCIALGHTAGYKRDRTPPIRLGRILANNVTGFVSTDFALTGGDSGGPLFDLNGKLIAIHSNIGTTLMENRHVPVDTFQADWDRLVNGERIGLSRGRRFSRNRNRPMLGVWLGDEIKEGVQVEVMPDGPAAQSGLRTGDIIRSVAGKPTRNGDDLLAAIASCKAGEAAEIQLLRDGQELKLQVTPLSERELYRRSIPQDPSAAPQENGGGSAKNQPEKEGQSVPNESDAQASNQQDQAAKLRAEAEKELAEKVKNAKENGGRVELSPELMQKFGDAQQFMARVRQLFSEGVPLLMPSEDKFFTDVVSGYRPIVADATQSVVRVMVGPKQVALGTVIREDGYVLTKASEVKGVTPTVQLNDGQRFAASVEKEFVEYDLALLKIPSRLPAAEFAAELPDLPLGTFVSAVGVDPTPLAIGVLSVAQRSLAAKDQPFLGISLRSVDGGLAIQSVVPNSAAEKAGLREGDIIRTMDGKDYAMVPLFIQSLGRKRPGDEVKLVMMRDGESLEQVVTLGGRQELPPELGEGRYPTGGKLSEQRDGYPSALQTDLPFSYNECGSPLVDLDGRIIGVNIARAGRTKSYAIPVAALRDLLKDALPE